MEGKRDVNRDIMLFAFSYRYAMGLRTGLYRSSEFFRWESVDYLCYLYIRALLALILRPRNLSSSRGRLEASADKRGAQTSATTLIPHRIPNLWYSYEILSVFEFTLKQLHETIQPLFTHTYCHYVRKRRILKGAPIWELALLSHIPSF